MAYTSDCGTVFTGYNRTPYMYVGNTYTVPNSPYSITLINMDCESSVPFPPDYSNTIRVFKNGVAIGDHTCYPFLTDPASCPTLFDGGNICISNVWMDCQTPNNCQYDIWYNEDLCAGVTCQDKCYGADLWSMKCDPLTGTCVQDVLKQASSPQCTITTTHILDLNVSPFSWYTPQGAADYLITNMTGINGAVVNWLAPFTGWTYIYTEIINDGSNVIIRIHLNDGSTAAPSMVSASNMQSLAVQIGLLEIGFIVVFVGVITLTVGIIVGVALIKVLTGTKEVEKQFTPQDVVKIVITDPDSIVARQLEECDINFAADAAGLKLCYDSVIKGAQDGLADKLNLPPPTINSPTETQKCLDQYLIDSNWANYQTCLKAVKDKAGGELLAGVTCPSGQYYNVDQGKCITTEDCWIPGMTPGSCILTAKTGKTIAIIGGVIVGGYLVFNLIKK